ncbi:hypothetical protein RCC89_17165 [Cytophagaceae bacterium ABcell3]|nr:hypothetical protein RCC89_17165 [Cytophagaceae bacterium ABcell3]
MGETYFWDEFVNFSTGKEQGRILFGDSFDETFKKLSAQALKMSLYEIAKKSSLHQDFDIKHKEEYAEHGPMTGKLFFGKYVSARSAGNYLAGYNGTHRGRKGLARIRLDYIGYMKAAGYYNATGRKDFKMFVSGLTGKSKYPGPTYGEDLYSARWIARGIQNNPNMVKLRLQKHQDILNYQSAIENYDTDTNLQKYFKR